MENLGILEKIGEFRYLREREIRVSNILGFTSEQKFKIKKSTKKLICVFNAVSFVFSKWTLLIYITYFRYKRKDMKIFINLFFLLPLIYSQVKSFLV